MKLDTTILIFFCVLSISTSAQDNYHLQLAQQLQTEYNLSGGEWVIYDQEEQVTSAAFAWGETETQTIDIDGMAFTKSYQIDVQQTGNRFWNNGMGIELPGTVDSGDVILAVFWMRSTQSELGFGSANIFFERNSAPWTKHFYVRPIFTDQWQQYMIPFVMKESHIGSEAKFGMHLAFQEQILEMGGLALINYKQNYTLADLPQQLHNDNYAGQAPTAPWRLDAKQRIDEIRKAPLRIEVVDVNGHPVQDASVKVEMMRHEYTFGTAIRSCRLAGNRCSNDTYVEKILDIDGRGHGFNSATTQQAFRWRNWEGQWPADNSGTVDAVKWLSRNGIMVRGKHIFEPSLYHVPDDVMDNWTDASYIKDRMNQHLVSMLNFPGIRGVVDEWDVLYQSTYRNSIPELFRESDSTYQTGYEFYLELFEKVRRFQPSAKLFMTDDQIFTQGGLSRTSAEGFFNLVDELTEIGADVGGIGLKSEIYDYPIPPVAVGSMLDYIYGKTTIPLKITEFRMNDLPETVSADFIRDFMTMVFSHPATDGFSTYSFWDDDDYLDNALFYDTDWQLKPTGQAYIDLVYRDWWTDENQQTNQLGVAEFRPFKGTHLVTMTCGDFSWEQEVELSDEKTIVIETPCFSTGSENLEDHSIQILPNPSTDGRFVLSLPQSDPTTLNIFDSVGRLIYDQQISTTQHTIDLSASPAGTYLLIMEQDGRTSRQFLMLQ